VEYHCLARRNGHHLLMDDAQELVSGGTAYFMRFATCTTSCVR
jgi:hypothetical protein